MTDTPKKLIVNVANGTSEYIDLTPAEIAERDQQAAKAAEKAAKYCRRGIECRCGHCGCHTYGRCRGLAVAHPSTLIKTEQGDSSKGDGFRDIKSF